VDSKSGETEGNSSSFRNLTNPVAPINKIRMALVVMTSDAGKNLNRGWETKSPNAIPPVIIIIRSA
jgi:hypothetical protein